MEIIQENSQNYVDKLEIDNLPLQLSQQNLYENVKIDSNKMLLNDDDYEEGDSLIVRKMQEDQQKNVNIEDQFLESVMLLEDQIKNEQLSNFNQNMQRSVKITKRKSFIQTNISTVKKRNSIIDFSQFQDIQRQKSQAINQIHSSINTDISELEKFDHVSEFKVSNMPKQGGILRGRSSFMARSGVQTDFELEEAQSNNIRKLGTIRQLGSFANEYNRFEEYTPIMDVVRRDHKVEEIIQSVQMTVRKNQKKKKFDELAIPEKVKVISKINERFLGGDLQQKKNQQHQVDSKKVIVKNFRTELMERSLQGRNLLKANFKKYDNGSDIYNPKEPYASEPLKSKYFEFRSIQHIQLAMQTQQISKNHFKDALDDISEAKKLDLFQNDNIVFNIIQKDNERIKKTEQQLIDFKEKYFYQKKMYDRLLALKQTFK